MTETKRSINPLMAVFLLSGLLFVLFLIVSGVLFFSKSSGSWSDSSKSQLFASEGVGVLEIKGVIIDSKKALKQLKKLEENKNVKALVVRLNSPGGSVAPSQEIYEAIRKFPKPVVSSMDSVAASGAYYIACGTQKIFANAGTLTGSIGVIMEFANLKKLYEWAKVERFAIKTGKFKDTGSESRDMTEEERQFLQNLVDDVLVQFKTAVSTGRKLTMEEVTPLADGRIFTGSQAKRVKLVDELGTFQDAINAAGELGKIKGKPRVITVQDRKPRIWEQFLDQGGDDDESASYDEGTTSILKEIAAGLSSIKRIREPGVYWLWDGAY